MISNFSHRKSLYTWNTYLGNFLLQWLHCIHITKLLLWIRYKLSLNSANVGSTLCCSARVLIFLQNMNKLYHLAVCIIISVDGHCVEMLLNTVKDNYHDMLDVPSSNRSQLPRVPNTRSMQNSRANPPGGNVHECKCRPNSLHHGIPVYRSDWQLMSHLCRNHKCQTNRIHWKCELGVTLCICLSFHKWCCH